ncbi:MAG: UvrB/UvrC motif-containing protein [Verrucomicrobiae bacterium]|nr:UvrB/UvrC motif-containing protein [Verrucomicrobiae bacterium]MDW7980577.1 UvrB/UvrC motif-containing protein [Verrucomicrobiales bacterium]
MLCCFCKQKEAKVHYSKVEGNKIQKLDMCEECAKQKGFDDPTAYALADLLLGLGTTQEIERAPSAAEPKCPKCGFSQSDFKKSGRLGCADCYTTFAEGLESLLKSMHKGVRHVGKVPMAAQQTHDIAERIKTLQKRLDKAIQEENFELAATLRDEIKQLKEQLAHGSLVQPM